VRLLERHRLEKNLQVNACGRVGPFRVALAAHASTSMKLKRDAGFGDAYRYLSPEGLRVKTTGYGE
jgi:hypothetical protein